MLLISLCVPAPPLLLPCHNLLFVSFLCCLLLVLLGLGRSSGTFLQTSAGYAAVSGLAALTLHSHAHQRGPAFVADVDIRTIRLYWRRGVSRQRCPLLLHLFPPLNLDQSARQTGLALSVLDSLYY